MKNKIKILGIQINPVIGDKNANFQKVTKLLNDCYSNELDLVVLPEVFNIGNEYKIFEKMSEPDSGDTASFLSDIAQKYKTNIIGGSFIEKCDNDLLKNTSMVFDRKGNTIGKYSKIHLFSYFGCDEGKYISGGDKTVIVEADFGKVGLSICYDLRFPELYRTMAYAGAQIVVCPSAFPDNRYEHRLTLTKARSIENLFYMISVNQAGEAYGGKSIVTNPWGEVISCADNKEGAMFIELDLNLIDKIRKEFPVLEDRNIKAYRV